MLARDGRSVLDHLVDSGALTPERRDLVRPSPTRLRPRTEKPDRLQESLDGARALSYTLSRRLPRRLRARETTFEGAEVVPVEPEGKYSRLDELGRGGQSIVWRALDRFVGRGGGAQGAHLAGIRGVPGKQPARPEPASSARRGSPRSWIIRASWPSTSSRSGRTGRSTPPRS